jgi:NADP-dependent 3-hydroxy acid dehydrogenase YdfG
MTTVKALTLITSANQGLGFAAAKQLVSTGKYRLLIGARSHENVKGMAGLRWSRMVRTLSY